MCQLVLPHEAHHRQLPQQCERRYVQAVVATLCVSEPQLILVQDLAKTNLAFISDKESWAAQVAYVEVASWYVCQGSAHQPFSVVSLSSVYSSRVFSVRPHSNIERGCIGLNTLQRKVRNIWLQDSCVAE